jgi:hypothetical protein
MKAALDLKRATDLLRDERQSRYYFSQGQVTNVGNAADTFMGKI